MQFEAVCRARGDHSAEHQTSLFCFSNLGLKSLSPALICSVVMSECMSVTYKAIQVVVKELHPHRAPGRLRKIGGRLFDEPLSAIVLIEFVLARHAGHVEIGIPILIQ